jgi:hypothetical protein
VGFEIENDPEIGAAFHKMASRGFQKSASVTHEIPSSHGFQKLASSGPDLDGSLDGIEEKNVFQRTARVTVYDMIRYTPLNIRENRLKGCRVYFYNSERFERKGKRSLRLFGYKTGCSKKTYMTQIGYVDYTKNLQSTVWVHCDCDYFKYFLEYSMAVKGASDHLDAFRQPPVEKNPQMLPGACKHILAILDDSLRRTRQFAKLDKNRDLELEEADIEGKPVEHEKMPTQNRLNKMNQLPRTESPDVEDSGKPKSVVPQVYRRNPQPKNTEPSNRMRQLPNSKPQGEDEG